MATREAKGVGGGTGGQASSRPDQMATYRSPGSSRLPTSKRLKAKQVANAWIGAVIGGAVVVLWALVPLFIAEVGPVVVPQPSPVTSVMLVVGLGVVLAAASPARRTKVR